LPKKPIDERDALLASIRGASGGKSLLKPVAERELPANPSASTSDEPAGDIASALRNALMSRQAATMGVMSDATENDSGSDGDDEDW
jgi:hypothetical protein